MPFLTIPEEEIAMAAQAKLDNILTIGLVAVLALAQQAATRSKEVQQ